MRICPRSSLPQTLCGPCTANHLALAAIDLSLPEYTNRATLKIHVIIADLEINANKVYERDIVPRMQVNKQILPALHGALTYPRLQ